MVDVNVGVAMVAAIPLFDRALGGTRGPAGISDRLIQGFLAGLRFETTVFHVGQYCGRWRASTSGRALASYHLVLAGRCHAFIEGQPPLELGPRDGLFFLRDTPHILSFDADRRRLEQAQPTAMRPLYPAAPDGVGLACGFFHFRGGANEAVLDGLPDHVLIRGGTPGLEAASVIFDLILAESGHPPDDPSPLVARLVDLLFYYVLRHAVQQDPTSTGVWALARHATYAGLVEAISREPGRDWSVEAMAREVHMSRASFFKHFVEVGGSSPAQLVVLLRMRAAARRIQDGDSIQQAAAAVGYQSLAAFSRAFKRVLGVSPSAYRPRSP
jgi:AraC family transcriptional regulator, activator of mtrCDE